MNSSPNAPGKEGRERSDRWKETLGKGFLPRVSDATGSPGPGGYGRPKRRPNRDVIIIVFVLVRRIGEFVLALGRQLPEVLAVGIDRKDLKSDKFEPS